MLKPGLQDLEAVIAVARRSSFRAAALDLGMSTTALSNAVGKLEAHLGVRLFNRTTRSVSLSDAGRVFVDSVGPALQDIHGAMDAARSQQAMPSGTLRINSYATAAREILSPLVLEFLRRYPQVHVDLVTEGRLRRHRRRGLRPRRAPRRPRAERHDRDLARAAAAQCRRRLAGLFRKAWQAAASRPTSSTTGASVSGCRTARCFAGSSRRAANRC